MTHHRLRAVPFAAGLLAASCSSSDDPATSPPSELATSGVPASSVPASTVPASSLPAASDVAATTAPPTTVTPSSAAPTTTSESTARTQIELPPRYVAYTSEVYDDLDTWLCHPAQADNVCDRNLDTTVVSADGTTEVVPHVPAASPEVACFYVYPTVSRDPGSNSDLVPSEDAEINTVINQAARFSQVCDVYAPMYRQVTLDALFNPSVRAENARDIGPADVLDAFRHFVANDLGDRPYVLIGHSQGAGVLRSMMQAEIDPSAALRERMLSAMLLGTSVAVPVGADVGGDFEQIPACGSADQVQCVISYASFRSTAPPPDDALFGRTGDNGAALCTNPVDPEGGVGESISYFETSSGAFADPAADATIDTPFVSFPGLLTLECRSEGAFTYLEVTVLGDPADPRKDDIGGDLTPSWGLHLVDTNVAMGDLVALVETQFTAYADA